MKVPKENAQSFNHFIFSRLDEIIEKTFQSTRISNKINIKNLNGPGIDGMRFPNRIIKYNKTPFKNKVKIKVVISFFI